jgi:hypothetical protein
MKKTITINDLANMTMESRWKLTVGQLDEIARAEKVSPSELWKQYFPA